jgi:hypothetical protein
MTLVRWRSFWNIAIGFDASVAQLRASLTKFSFIERGRARPNASPVLQTQLDLEMS